MSETTELTTTQTEDREIAVAAEVLEDFLHLVEPDKRLAVLTMAVVKEEAAIEKRGKNGLLDWLPMDEDSMAAYRASPGWRYHNRIQKFKSLIIQVFTRDITNDNSPEGAARLLFMHHANGNGSGWLPDYLDGLPALKIDLKKAAIFHKEHC